MHDERNRPLLCLSLTAKAVPASLDAEVALPLARKDMATITLHRLEQAGKTVDGAPPCAQQLAVADRAWMFADTDVVHGPGNGCASRCVKWHGVFLSLQPSLASAPGTRIEDTEMPRAHLCADRHNTAYFVTFCVCETVSIRHEGNTRCHWRCHHGPPF